MYTLKKRSTQFFRKQKSKTSYSLIYKLKSQWMLSLLLALLFGYNSNLNAQPVPTNEWVSIFSNSGLIVNGEPAKTGYVVQAFDPQGVLAGEFIVTTPGNYGLMSVYKDDPFTEADEGALEGDSLTFTINGFSATPTGPDEAIWSTNGDVKEIGLTVSSPDLLLSSSFIDFGDVNLFDSTATELTIESSGDLALTIDSVLVTYRFERQLSATNLSTVIEPTENGTVTVVFEPEVGSGQVEATLFIYSDAAFAGEIIEVPISANIVSDVVLTNEWINIFSNGETSINGSSVIAGDVIDAYDPDGVHVGTYNVNSNGSYGLMSAFKNDPFTEEDEGAEIGDTLSFTINGFAATIVNDVVPIWQNNGDVLEINLVANSNFAPEVVEMPSPVTILQGTTEATLVDDLTALFFDFEDDELTFEATTAKDNVELSILGAQLNISLDSLFIGEFEILISASDEFNTTSLVLLVRVVASPIIESQIDSHNFGEIFVGSAKVDSFKVYNTGGELLIIESATTGLTDLTIEVEKFELEEGDSSLIKITFNGTEVGDYTGEITLLNNSTNSTEVIISVSAMVVFQVSTDENASKPIHFNLHQNYPNPFNPSTNIQFSLPKTSLVELNVFDLTGRHVATLFSGRKASGNHTVAFNASQLSSGIYIYRIKAGEFVQTKRMLLIK